MQNPSEKSSVTRTNGVIGALLGFLGAVFITYLWVQLKLGGGDGYQALGVGIIGFITVPFVTLAGLVIGLLERNCVFGLLLRGFTAALAGICVCLGIAMLAQDKENERLYGGLKSQMLAVTERGDIANAALTPVDGSAYWICSVSKIKPGDIPTIRSDNTCWIPDQLPVWQPDLKFRLSVRWFKEEHFSDEDFLVLMPVYENKEGLFFVISFRADDKVCIYTSYRDNSSFELKSVSATVCSVIAK